MAVNDITLEDKDLKISNGDFVIEQSDPQHIELIIDSHIGSWKQYPLCGVGIENFTKSSGQSLALKRTISVQLEADGYSGVDVTVNPLDVLDITVSAERNG
jgi:hypothetical protein